MNAGTDLLDDANAGCCDPTLRQDVMCVLLECHRDRGAASVFAQGLDGAALEQFAAVVARRLGPRIGGRYVTKGVYRDGWAERAARDEAVWKAFTGRNHLEVMREFGISRRLLYSILSRRRRRGD